ncbi:MAG: Flp family type IVb pilin [Gaiella sp.]
MRAFVSRLLRRRNEDGGQGLVEYALIIALVSLAAIAALGFLSGKIQNVFSKSGNSLAAVEGSIGSGGGGSPPPPPPPPPPSAPTGGSVTITPGGPTQLFVTLNGTTPGGSWTSGTPITNYQFVWERSTQVSVGSIDCGSLSYAPVVTDNQADGTSNVQPQTGASNNTCFRAVVTATNSAGTSAPVTSNAVIVAGGLPGSLTISSPDDSTPDDGDRLRASAMGFTNSPDDYQFEWERSNVGSDSNCTNAAGGTSHDSDQNNQPIDDTDAVDGTSNRYCYRVRARADNVNNAWGPWSAYSAWFWVDN